MPCISGNTGIITGLINHFTVTAKEHLNPHQWCDLIKCLDLRTATACSMGSVGIIAYHNDFFQLFRVQWQQLLFIFQKDHGFFCGLQQFTRMRRIVVASFLPLAVQHMKLIHDMQDVHHLFVKLCFLDLSV